MEKNPTPTKQKRFFTKGFTLIELLVVIAIIGLLSAVILAPIQSSRKKARDAKRNSELRSLKTALTVYFDDNGSFPVVTASTDTNWRSTCSGAGGALTGTFSTVTAATVIPSVPTAFFPNYISQMPMDPLNQAGSGTAYCYAYRSNGSQYKVVLYNITEATVAPANLVDQASPTTATKWAICEGATACLW